MHNIVARVADASKRRGGEEGGSATGKREKDPVFLFPYSPLPFSPTLLTPAMQANNIVHILLIASLSSSVSYFLILLLTLIWQRKILGHLCRTFHFEVLKTVILFFSFAKS